MKKRIAECLSSVGTTSQVDKILDHFMLESIEDSGFALPDIQELLRSARECLNGTYVQVPDENYHSHLAIHKLGRQRQQENGQNADKNFHKTARHMAQILCAYGEDISLTAASQEDGVGGREMKFLISSESKTREPLVSMIRSVYGKAETSLAKMPDDFGINMYAGGSVGFQGREAKQKGADKDFDKCEAWTSAILSSLPENGNYKVTLRLTPVSRTEDAVRRRSRLNKYYRRLRLCSDVNWSNNINLGRSLNGGMNMVEGMMGKDTDGSSSSYGLTMAGQNVHKEAMLLGERLEHEISRLSRIEQETLWAISIRVSAQDMDTIQTLTSVLSGTMEEANIYLAWSQRKPDSPILALTGEILPLAMFPTKEFPGFGFVQNEEFSLSRRQSGEGFTVGELLWNGTAISSFDMAPQELSRHAFICGMTGSGKTNTLFKILEGVNLPFCVIEPVKGEYRALKSVCPDLQVWTMKVADSSSPDLSILQMNPFWFPVGGNVAFHIDSLKTIIASSFELTAAMPNILEQCLYNIYVKAGWDLVTGRNVYWKKLPEAYLYPTFSDLCTEVEDYIKNSDFSGETKGDYKGALLSRLKSFVSGYKGIVLNTNVCPDYGQIMRGHSVLELEGLADDADKCLVMGTVLVQYYQYLKLHFSSSGQKLQHLLIIEEAHRLFKNTKNSRGRTDGGPDPTGQLVDSLSNMMAEIRAFGEGMLIVDQSPTKIAEDVIKNSAAKIVHRIDNSNDIKALQSSMLLPDDILSFASLAQGEALIRTDGMEKPCKVKILCSDIKEKYNLSDSFQGGGIDESPLADVFIANSVLNNEKAAELIQERVSAFLNCITMFGMEHWYDITESLLWDILDVLRSCKMLDMVEYKMSVLSEIISIAIKSLYSGESKLDMGTVHMFAMRLLDFFREQKEGRLVKPKAIEIFQRYLDRNVSDIVRASCLQHTGGQEHIKLCREAGLDPNETFSMIVTCFIHDVAPAFEYGTVEADPDHLMTSFLQNCIPAALQQGILEKYYPAFEKLAAYLGTVYKGAPELL